MDEDFSVERIGRKEVVKRLVDSEFFETVEEVFDYWTLMALYRLLNRKIIRSMNGVVAAGKEARVYLARGWDGSPLAVKIFLVMTAEFRQGMVRYIEGDARFRKVRRSRRHLIRIWCSKEFKNLVRAYEAGVRVPRPIVFEENVLVMEFIGRVNDAVKPAPLLKDMPPDNPEEAYSTILEYVKRLVSKARLVHADLSEYNILNNEGDLVIIDWGSAVLLSHPNAWDFLKRDVENINRFFGKLGVKTMGSKEILEGLKAFFY